MSKSSRLRAAIRERGAGACEDWLGSSRQRNRSALTGLGLLTCLRNHPNLVAAVDAAAVVDAARSRASPPTAPSSNRARLEPGRLAGHAQVEEITRAPARPARPIQRPGETALHPLPRHRPDSRRAKAMPEGSTGGAAGAGGAVAGGRKRAVARIHQVGRPAHRRATHRRADAQSAEIAGIEWASRTFA